MEHSNRSRSFFRYGSTPPAPKSLPLFQVVIQILSILLQTDHSRECRISKALRNRTMFRRASLQLLFSCWRINEQNAVSRADFLNDIPNTLNVHRILVHVHLQSSRPMVHIVQLQLVLVRSHPFQRAFRIQQVSSFREQIKREVTRCARWRCVVCGENFLIVTCGQIRQF